MFLLKTYVRKYLKDFDTKTNLLYNISMKGFEVSLREEKGLIYTVIRKGNGSTAYMVASFTNDQLDLKKAIKQISSYIKEYKRNTNE